MPQTKRDHTLFTLFLCFVILLLIADTSTRKLHRSLQEALLQGDVTTVQRLLRCHFTLDEASFQPALGNAVLRGDEKTVLTLLAYRPRLPLTQALCDAVRAKSPNMVQLLLSQGADPNGHDRVGNSVLCCCLTADERERDQSLPTRIGNHTAQRQEILQLLRRSGAHLDLYEAIRFAEVNELKLQLKQGGDPNACPDGFMTALGYAYSICNARRSDAKGAQIARRRQVIALLHVYGAHCSFQEAVLQGLGEELKWQLAQGADPNARLSNGYPALFVVASTGNTEIVRILLDHGAKVDAVSPYGRTALMAARVRGHADVAALLLARGTDSELAMQAP